MNKKWLPYVLIGLMAIAVIIIKQCQQKKIPTPKPRVNNKDTRPTHAPSAPTNRDKGFDRRTAYLEYSKHAKCRMKCRNISQAEVEELMQDGKINYNKSDVSNSRCPRYAVEGVTKDDQQVRIVYAQCNDKTVVVTVIDLATNFKCSCPGDDDK